jgi:hypothetical protein
MNFESEQERTYYEKYYGGTLVHCWACGGDRWDGMKLIYPRFLRLFRRGPAVLRGACRTCTATRDFKPGEIRIAKNSYGNEWIWSKRD